MLQLLPDVSYAAAVNCCYNNSSHNVIPQARLRGTRPAPPPNPSTAPASSAQPNPRTLHQSVTGTRVQSIPSAGASCGNLKIPLHCKTIQHIETPKKLLFHFPHDSTTLSTRASRLLVLDTATTGPQTYPRNLPLGSRQRRRTGKRRRAFAQHHHRDQEFSACPTVPGVYFCGSPIWL